MLSKQTADRFVAQPARRQLLRGLLGGGVALLLAACGGQAGGVAVAKPTAVAAAAKEVAKPAAGGVTVEMNDQNRFVPAALTVRKGTTVTFKNVGTMLHNIVTDPAKAADKAHAKVPAGAQVFDSGYITAGGSWSYTFTVAGEYTYFCLPHESLGMVATISVTE